MNYYIGIDVGTGSARAGIFDRLGRSVASKSFPIRLWKSAEGHAEQSSENIWDACCQAVRGAMKSARLHPSEIGGLGFGGTCSLVVLGASDQPLSVSTSGMPSRNVIVWMDHRAVAEADRINRSKHPALKYVGGKISPEMQMPKLLWLKRHLPQTWQRATGFFDLPDYLTFRATGDDTRSLCSTVCKWNYRSSGHGESGGWDEDFFRRIGLRELADEGFTRIGTKIRPMGQAIASGLSIGSAKALGLAPGTPVGVSIIDAHAGGLGVLGANIRHALSSDVLNRRVALIGGTSSCIMAASPKPRFIRGVWGPYHSAMLPSLWLSEGGQSASGALIDHLIHSHPRSKQLCEKSRRAGVTVYETLNDHLEKMARAERADFPAELTRDLHVSPDFQGNRSPRADPTLKGGISGLSISSDLDNLARLYLATVQGVAYGVRHIIEALNEKGYAIDTIFACGGGIKNPVFIREHADITGCRIVLPRQPEAVLLGAAILGAVANGEWRNINEAMAAMNRAGEVIVPRRGSVARYHAAKYKVFHKMSDHFISYRSMMEHA
jgi:FGGY-family pentulose kinase